METLLHYDRLSRSNSPRPATGIVHLGLGAFFVHSGRFLLPVQCRHLEAIGVL